MHRPNDSDPIEEDGAQATLGRRLLGGHAAALARAITWVENGSADAVPVLRTIQPHLGRALVLGITGAPGVGKSTLVNALIRSFRARERSVGVVAVDPSSPLTGGAILGDRIRMSEHAADQGVFVRSVASRGHPGGLPPVTARVVDLMDAAGRDVVIIETVGAGQSEVEVTDVADTKVVVCMPGSGDEIQAIKAGILEIADILVVNKSDLPLAGRTVRQLEEMVSLRGHTERPVPVLSTTATTGDGVAALVRVVQAHHARLRAAGRCTDPCARVHRLIAAAAARMIDDHVRRLPSSRLEALCHTVQRGELDVDAAARRLLREEIPSGEVGFDR